MRDLVVVDTKRAGVSCECVRVDEAGGVANEAAAADVDRWVVGVNVDEQPSSGVHRRVTDERAVGDGGRRERAEERDATFVGLEPRRVDKHRDVKRGIRRLWIGNDGDPQPRGYQQLFILGLGLGNSKKRLKRLKRL